MDGEPVIPDDEVINAGEDRIALPGGLRNLPLPALSQMLFHRAGKLIPQPVSPKDRAGLGEGGGIGGGRTGGDRLQGISDHVREDNGGKLRRVGHPRQLAALRRGEVLAHRVQFIDRRPCPKQHPRYPPLLLQGDPRSGQRQQRRAAAGDQADH